MVQVSFNFYKLTSYKKVLAGLLSIINYIRKQIQGFKEPHLDTSHIKKCLNIIANNKLPHHQLTAAAAAFKVPYVHSVQLLTYVTYQSECACNVIIKYETDRFLSVLESPADINLHMFPYHMRFLLVVLLLVLKKLSFPFFFHTSSECITHTYKYLELFNFFFSYKS